MANGIRLGAVSVMAWAAWAAWAGAAAAAPDSAATREDIAVLKRAARGFSEVAKKAVPAVVFVTVERTVTAGPPQGGDSSGLFGDPFFDQFFGRPNRPERRAPRQFRQQGQGTGFLITADGFILTNSHVVDGADKIKVRLHGGRTVDAKLVGADPRSDVAVLKIEGDGHPFLPLGDSDAIEVGEWVVAVGNPFGLSESLTVGVVSAKGRSVGLADYEDFIQTDAAINPGNSGGPLLNIDGQVIGINSAIFSQSGGYMGIGFAVPINMAASIYAQIAKTGSVVRGYLGVMIQDVTADLAPSFGLDRERGVLVSEVVDESPAAEAGLQTGDVILEQDGKRLDGVAAFRNGIALMAPDTEMTLKVRRDGKDVTVKVKLGRQADEDGAPAAAGSVAEKLGLTVQALTPELRERLGVDAGPGVVVTGVAGNSPAAGHGLREGDVIASVNRQTVDSPRAFLDALESSKKSGRVLLLVKSRRTTRYVVIPVD